MRRLLMGTVVVGIVLSAAVCFAQTDGAPAMPEKVRKALEYRIGTWNYVIEEEDIKAELVYRWAPGKTCIVGDIHGMAEGSPFFSTHIIGWDGESENGTRMNMVSDVENWSDHSKILPDATEEGPFSGFLSGKEYSGRQRLVKQDQDHMTLDITDRKHGNDSLSDWKILFTRAKPTTREDFEEFCKLNEGAWVGRTALGMDIPGLGKKGEMATAHYDYTIIEDGAGLLGKSYWPGGTNTWLMAYDEDNQQIISMGVSPIFGVDSPTIRYSNRRWRCRENHRDEDGTKYEATITGTFSEDGKTMTVIVSGPDGEKAAFTDVWHRMNLKTSK